MPDAPRVYQLDHLCTEATDDHRAVHTGPDSDILSHERPGEHRFIEVKTTNVGHAFSLIISRNELDFAAEAEEAFHLYRVFQFREQPKLCILKGSLEDQVHLEPIDYRASFRRVVG